MPLSRRNLLTVHAAAKPVLVCLFQRGAADGLNSVVPYADADYYRLRPTIAVPKPGQSGGAIDLDGRFGLHPALAPLLPWYKTGRLALVHACGIPHGVRSHFEAQRLAECGLGQRVSRSDSGWLGRYLSRTARAGDRPLRAVAINGSLPASLQGAVDPLAIDDIAVVGFGPASNGYQRTLGALYASAAAYAEAASDALRAIDEIAAANLKQFAPDKAALYPISILGARLKQAAQLIKADLGVEVICIDSDGWDHHQNLPIVIAPPLTDLGKALAAFATDMGEQLRRVNLIVMSEFGRRVAENSSKGSDHGTAGCVYLLGGGVNGGQVAGTWPGLSGPAMASGEDLAITTDLRGVLAQMLERRFGYEAASGLFPGYTPSAVPDLFAKS